MLSRRNLVLGAAVSAAAPFPAIPQGFSPAPSGGLLNPFVITVRRKISFANTLNIGDCIHGDLFLKDVRQFDMSKPFCQTIELPYRNELSNASSIKAGSYNGHIREDGHLGWRIELEGTKQSNIQIHVGNLPSNSEGCILVGLHVNETPCDPPPCKPLTNQYYQHVCQLSDSVSMRNAIKTAYGNQNSRKVSVYVVDVY